MECTFLLCQDLMEVVSEREGSDIRRKPKRKNGVGCGTRISEIMLQLNSSQSQILQLFQKVPNKIKLK